MPIAVSKLSRMAEEIVVPYSEEHAQAHAEFAARNWPDNQLRRDPRYIRWKYRSAASGPIEGLLLAVRDNRVVGQLGLTPLVIRTNGTEHAVQWASDFRVEPAFRLQGIGPMLIAKAVSGELPFITDGPTVQSRPILQKLGLRELKGPQEMHLPMAPMRAASRFLNRTVVQKERRLVQAISFLAPMYLGWRTRRLRQPGEYCRVVKCRWQEVAGLVREAQRTNVVPHVVHDARFLNWRCTRLGEGLDGMHGLLTNRGGHLLFGKQRSQLYAFDWAASDWEECRALFSTVWNAGREMGVDSLTVLVNRRQEQEWLHRLGFFAAASPVEVYYYSHGNSLFPTAHLHFCHLDAHANL